MRGELWSQAAEELLPAMKKEVVVLDQLGLLQPNHSLCLFCSCSLSSTLCGLLSAIFLLLRGLDGARMRSASAAHRCYAKLVLQQHGRGFAKQCSSRVCWDWWVHGVRRACPSAETPAAAAGTPRAAEHPWLAASAAAAGIQMQQTC